MAAIVSHQLSKDVLEAREKLDEARLRKRDADIKAFASQGRLVKQIHSSSQTRLDTGLSDLDAHRDENQSASLADCLFVCCIDRDKSPDRDRSPYSKYQRFKLRRNTSSGTTSRNSIAGPISDQRIGSPRARSVSPPRTSKSNPRTPRMPSSTRLSTASSPRKTLQIGPDRSRYIRARTISSDDPKQGGKSSPEVAQLKELMRKVYQRNDKSSKLSEIDGLVEKHRGNERALYEKICGECGEKPQQPPFIQATRSQ